jgi:hypothetical protein
LHRYLVRHFAADLPFDQLARELVTGQGNTLHRPAANFFRISPTPEDAAESFAQLFLGVRFQCAKCHNHPFETLHANRLLRAGGLLRSCPHQGEAVCADERNRVRRRGRAKHSIR